MTAVVGTSRPIPAGRRRTAARLAAVQALYQLELAGASVDSVISEFVHHRLGRDGEGDGFGDADPGFFAALVRGAAARHDELDRLIAAALTPEWPLERLESVLRAILRAGAYELLACPDVPVPVVISEYLDIGHAFFGGREPGLVNGVLDRLARTLRSNAAAEGEYDGGAASR
ncbi:MAG TPA: transcription antitermination factor NusB [Stellaceae bacterium]|nr:transcription antitermination factor NusB [Stellaceae bacterium]